MYLCTLIFLPTQHKLDFKSKDLFSLLQMNEIRNHNSETSLANAVQQENDWTKKTTATASHNASQQCLLDEIMTTLPKFWQDYILEVRIIYLDSQ